MRQSESRFLVALVAGAFWSTSLSMAQGHVRANKAIASIDRSAEKRAELPSAETLAKTRAPEWVHRKPSRSTQTQKSVSARGINPCMTPDPGFGAYTEWDRSPSVGQMISPQRLRLGPRGEFDVVFHFHGHEAARKEWVAAVDTGVLVAIDLGTGSGPYMKKFADPARFTDLLRSVEERVAERAGVPHARARRIGLSAWSAGYGAVESILRSPLPEKRIDSVVLLDGLHTGYDDGGGVSRSKLAPFATFARRAAKGDAFMFVSHSSIVPPGYASTTETANYLVWQVGGEPERAHARAGDPMGLELLSRYSRGEFHVRGFRGNDVLDHCAHLGLFRDVVRARLAPRWGLAVRPSPARIAAR